jgi:hypothetical protein
MVHPVSNTMSRFIETDLSTRVYRFTCGVNESIATAANEPSMGLYRLQEHVINSVPKLVREKQSIDELQDRLKGANFDMGYDVGVVRDIGGITNFENISISLDRAIEMRRLLLEKEKTVNQQRIRVPPQNYGATGHSPPILRKENQTTSNSSPLTVKGSIQPKTF